MKRFVLFSLILCSSYLQSCFDTGCPDFLLENAFLISFELYEANTDNNLLELGSYYDRDSVKVYNSNNELLFDGPVEISGKAYISPYYGLPYGNIPHNRDTSEFYFLHLIEGGLDVDTFRIDYRTKTYDCNDKQFSYLDFYYNGVLIQCYDGPESIFYVRLEKEIH